MIGPAVRCVFSVTDAQQSAAKTTVATGTVWGVSITGAECRTADVTVGGVNRNVVGIALPLSTAAQRTRAANFLRELRWETKLGPDLIATGEDVWAPPSTDDHPTWLERVFVALSADASPVVAP